jgi:hypothetical protein
MLEDMSALPALDWLDLSDNELSGPLPAFPLAVRCDWLAGACVRICMCVHVIGQQCLRKVQLVCLIVQYQTASAT